MESEADFALAMTNFFEASFDWTKMKKTFEGLIDTSIVADPQLNASITPLQPNSSSDGSWSETFPLLSIKKDPWYISLISIVSASLLGIMLNILDAVSYGLIIFPVMSMPDIFGSIFLKDGITMFFVSTILSQIVYTFGGSKFKGGNGSCMIEIIPFLHSMIRTIAETNSNHDTIISTTLFCFAISSILTGFVFLLIGYFRWYWMF